MSRIKLKCALIGLVLAIVAGCGSANKDKAEQPPQAQPAVQQTSPEVAPPVAEPEAAAVTTAPRETLKEAKKTSSPRPTSRPAAMPAPPASPAAPAEPVPQAVQPSEVIPAPSKDIAPAAPKPPEPRFATIPKGAHIQARLEQALDSAVNKTGDRFRAIIDQDVLVNGKVVVPQGSLVDGRLSNVERSGRVEGRASMSLQLVSLQMGNETYPLNTDILAFEAESTKKNDATRVGVGAGLGAVIGAIAGGGKGAAIGAAVGAGAGGATVIVTRGKEVILDAEQKLRFELQNDVSVKLR